MCLLSLAMHLVSLILQIQMNTNPNADGVGNEYVGFRKRT